MHQAKCKLFSDMSLGHVLHYKTVVEKKGLIFSCALNPPLSCPNPKSSIVLAGVRGPVMLLSQDWHPTTPDPSTDKSISGYGLRILYNNIHEKTTIINKHIIPYTCMDILHNNINVFSLQLNKKNLITSFELYVRIFSMIDQEINKKSKKHPNPYLKQKFLPPLKHRKCMTSKVTSICLDEWALVVLQS